jgi:hypothetical protein
LRERRKEIDLMGDNLLAVVKQQKVTYLTQRFAKFVEPSRPLMIHKREYRCTWREKYIKVS